MIFSASYKSNLKTTSSIHFSTLFQICCIALQTAQLKHLEVIDAEQGPATAATANDGVECGCTGNGGRKYLCWRILGRRLV
jgi:hypothetical protein